MRHVARGAVRLTENDAKELSKDDDSVKHGIGVHKSSPDACRILVKNISSFVLLYVDYTCCGCAFWPGEVVLPSRPQGSTTLSKPRVVTRSGHALTPTIPK